VQGGRVRDEGEREREGRGEERTGLRTLSINRSFVYGARISFV
jgi:hypothetical protein